MFQNFHIVIDTSEEDFTSYYKDVKGTQYEFLPTYDLNKPCDEIAGVEEDENGNPTKVFKGIKFIPGHRYLVMGQKAYQYVKSQVHLGPRGEGFYDLTKMEYLLTRDGVIFKFIYVRYKRFSQFISQEQYDTLYPSRDILAKRLKWAELIKGTSKRTGRDYYMLVYYKLQDVNDEVSKFINKEDLLYPVPKVKYRKIVKTYEQIKEAFDFLDSYKGRAGLDYETNRFPFDDPHFYHMGVGITTMEGHGYYFDMDKYQREAGYIYRDIYVKGKPPRLLKELFNQKEVRMPGEVEDDTNFKYFRERYNHYLDLHDEDDYTFNVSFEQRATYLIEGVLRFFHEGSTINKLDILVKKNYSLKYTAMRVIHNSSWDDDFEYLSEVMGKLMEEKDENCRHKQEEVYYTNDPSKVQKFTRDEEGNITDTNGFDCETLFYTESDVWKEINERYPGHVEQFKWFLENRWGFPFACIPSDILGAYCCLDSFWTVLLHEYGVKQFSEKAWSTYDNNLRMGALLGIHGIPLDEDVRQKYEDMCTIQVMVGKMQLAKWWLNYQLSIPPKELVEFDGWTNIWKNNLQLDLNWIVEHYSSPLGFEYAKVAKDYGPQISNWIRDNVVLNPFDSSIANEEATVESWNNFISENTDISDVKGKITCHIKWFDKEEERNISVSDIEDYWRHYRQMVQVKFLLNQIDQNKPQLVFRFLEDDLKTISERDGYQLSEWWKDEIINFNSNEEIVNISMEVFNYWGNILWEAYDYDEESQFTSAENREERLMSTKVIPDEPGYMDTFLYDEEVTDEQGNKTGEVRHITRYLSIYDQCEFFRYKARLDKYFAQFPDTVVGFRRKTNEKGNPIIAEDGQHWVLEKVEFHLRETKAWREYQWSGDVFKLFAAVAYEEGFLMSPTNVIQPDYDIERVFRNFDAENPTIEEMYWEIGAGSDFHWVTLQAFYDRILEDWSTKKAFERLYRAGKIDVLDKTIAGIGVFQYYYKLFRKYEKVLGTYINGQFTKYTHTVNHEDKNLICTERWYDENKKELKVFSPFRVCEKQSKRWSAPTHTIPSKSEVKRCITTPPGYLLSYFDISGAEVRTLAYMSHAKFFLDCYAKHKDVYIESAKVVEPGMDADYYKGRRGVYKQILLGRMYGMGDEKMADMTESTLEESMERGKQMFALIPEVEEYIQRKSNYCVEHEGVCETITGDKMVMEGKTRDKWARLGINQVIQGFSAVALADGFYNNIYQSYKTGEIIIRPVNVVHDSSQNLFETKKLFEIIPFYQKHMRQYLLEKYKVDWAFDTEAGVNYYDMVDMDQLSPTQIKLKGTYTALTRFLDKLTTDGLQYWISSIQNSDGEELTLTNDGTYAEGMEPDIPDWGYKQSIVDGAVEARFEIDKSKYTAIINKGLKS